MDNRRRSRPIALAAVILVSVTLLHAQFKSAYRPIECVEERDPRAAYADDSTVTDRRSTGKYWIAAAEVLGSNAVMWSYARYIHKDTWARIGIHSIKNNLKNGFWWDEDGFMGNQFNHPYHGSSYFSAGRVNGLTFWESAPYALAGSAIWELFLETEPPSANDIVNTPVSGIILGEISFRITDLILDDSKRGFERILRESSSFLLNPMRGFNRLVRGEMWRVGPSQSHPDHQVWLSAGSNSVFRRRTIASLHGYALIRFDMDYGDLFAVSKHRDPFDYFTVHAEISLSENDNIIGIFASGVIWDKQVKLFRDESSVLGLYKEFDLLNNPVYHLTATSVSARLGHFVSLSSTVTLQTTLSLSPILMGGVNSQNAILYGKKYNIGPGVSSKASMFLTIQNYGNVYLNYRRFWLHTLNGADSEEFIGLLNLGSNYKLADRTMLGLDLLLYERFGNYRYSPNITDANAAARLYVRFLLW